MGICDGRTVIITGAARGLGRAYALAFGTEGANVVVNDIGTSLHGEGRDTSAADAVVEEIRSAGGKALANYEDITDWDAAKRIVDAAVATFGDLHVVVNNAGIVRDRMFVSATLEEWDATMHVHLRGHFCLSRHAVNYWREKQKLGANPDARIINTSSGAGLQGSIAQAAYSDPANIAPTVVWLGSSESAHVTGCVFELEGGKIMLEDGWREGPSLDKGACWAASEVGLAVDQLLAKRVQPRKVWGTA
ncbi:MAG: SDR family NAD(P)-dependent oxidoreductase [Sphingomonadales bacterium]|nr:SDR family NAD(P)-dependent oxidoreductase [Sphingomonadales bacterium]